MIDEKVETYITGLIRDAYAFVGEDQVYYRYPDAVFAQDKSITGKSSRIFGTYLVTVQVHVETEEKLDRDLFIKKLPRRKPLKIDGKTVRLVLEKTIQKDFLKLYNLSGAIFIFNFAYEIQEE